MANIIALDDVADAANLIRRILEKKGHSVVPFTDEEAAVRHVESNPVDLAILDIRLKKMNGIEVLEEIRKRSPETRVIMLTGYPTIESARRCLSLGADGYCVKPFENDELEKKVSEILREEKPAPLS